MAFLQPRSEFPPRDWGYWYEKYSEWGAWYSGDPEELLNFYTVMAIGAESAQEKFWARIETEERAGIVHLPAAGDVAETSANLLFSENPRYNFDEKAISGERINSFISENALSAILLESAELSAAISGCMLKIDIEPTLEKIPLVSVIVPKQFFPTFWRGRLWEVLFYRVVKETDSGIVYRLFENRKREGSSLLIEYKLMKGTTDNVGQEIDFNMIDETSNLNLESVKYDNIDGLGCVYVPNMRPNKLQPASCLGINDYSNCITLLDSLDFAWTSWMRDIELGMAQIFVDESLLTKQKSDTSGTLNYLNKFSKFKKSFIKLDLTSWKMGGENVKPIDSLQFDIRVDQHSKTCEQLFYQIVNQCGYSPQTFGIGDFGTAQSGTALKIRENKSQLTRMKKTRYWQPAVRALFIQMQKLDIQSNLHAGYEIDENITTEIEDSILTDTKEVSETIRNLTQATAISNYTKIKMLHSDWTEDQINEEVDKINKESGITGEIIPEEV